VQGRGIRNEKVGENCNVDIGEFMDIEVGKTRNEKVGEKCRRNISLEA